MALSSGDGQPHVPDKPGADFHVPVARLVETLVEQFEKGPQQGNGVRFPPLSSPADRVGLRDRAQKAEMMMDM